ncbi:unnamed protein product [Bursaphelenchus okinawaensis]|uniref:Uncharacterized protein n=1 Tax=Bursaphelenchus okinawaensis TaxID=465554 RepID=A0A811KCF7_9BILA|nr:unnamed protein product [Bursaphelenchus okinawaensis]CAG9098909.1 unnamed protein product [Bursaphelenchus okinawaensis]
MNLQIVFNTVWLLCSLISCTKLEKEPDELVSEIIERFDNIAQASVDMTEKLRLIKETSGSFLKLAIPMGSLLAASLDIVNEPDSKEYKALKRLHTHMTYEFKMARLQINTSFEVDHKDAQLFDFKKRVTWPLDLFMDRYLYMSDPANRKSNASVRYTRALCHDVIQ